MKLFSVVKAVFAVVTWAALCGPIWTAGRCYERGDYQWAFAWAAMALVLWIWAVRFARRLGDQEIARRAPPIVAQGHHEPSHELHYQGLDDPNQCAECGHPIGQHGQGMYVFVRAVWENPPPGFVKCRGRLQ